MFRLFAIATYLIITLFVHSHVYGYESYQEKTQKMVWKNKKCKKTKSCKLKNFFIEVTPSKSRFSTKEKFDWKVSMVGGYETKKLRDLEDFAVVQFIRGCLFQTDKETLDRTIQGRSRDYFGESIPFVHWQWEVDSLDTDPMYASAPLTKEFSRHAYHRTNKPNHFVSQPNKRYYRDGMPEKPILYFADMPTGSFINNTKVTSSNLEFKTCIYKTRDVPIVSDTLGSELGKPLHCFEWRSVYSYNPYTEEIEEMEEVHPICFRPVDRN